MNERQGESDSNLRTFENDSLIWLPDVAKSARNPTSVEKYPTRFVGEDADPRITKIVDWVDYGYVLVFSPRSAKIREFVEMRVLLESTTPFVRETTKVPKDFMNI